MMNAKPNDMAWTRPTDALVRGNRLRRAWARRRGLISRLHQYSVLKLERFLLMS